MKKIVLPLLALCMVMLLTACGGSGEQSGKQTAQAYLNQDSKAVIVTTVDLTDGWSVEFARGAAYIYDTEITEGLESTAMLVTLDKQVYEEDMAEAAKAEDYTEADGGAYYTSESGEQNYLAAVDGKAYVLITANSEADIKDIVSRVDLAIE